MDQNKLTETLAVNTGNMIASLNLQVAKLQTAHEEQDDSLRRGQERRRYRRDRRWILLRWYRP